MNIKKRKNIKKGKWIFTCSMQPQQFKSWDEEKSSDDYNREAFTDESWEMFSKYNDFTTLNGSSHAVAGCNLKLISDKYAKWFIKNECWNLLEKHKEGEYKNYSNFEKYEKDIKALCEKEGIEYEGI